MNASSGYPFKVLALALCLAMSGMPQAAFAASKIGLHRNVPKQQTLVVSLPTVVDRALNDNLNILTARARVGIARGSLIQAHAPLFPSIRGLFYVEKFNGGEVIMGAQPVDLDRTTFRPTLGADYTIHTGGKPLFQIWASRQQLSRTKLAVDMSKQEALLDACSGYFTLLKDIEREQVAQVALNEAESQLKIKELRLNAGVGTQLEVMQVQTLVRERQNLVLSTKNERVNSGYELLTHLNLPATLNLNLDADTRLVPLPLWQEKPNQNLEDLYRLAENNRADVRAVKAQITEARAQLGSAWSDLFPTITLSGYTRRIGPELNDLQKTSQGSFSVSMDLLKNMGVGTAGTIKSASARIKEAALASARQLQDIQKSISQAMLDYNLSKDQMDLAKQRSREAEEAYRVAKARFDAGVALNLDVIQAESAMTNARLSLQTAVMSYNIAQLQLLYETGQLTPDTVLLAHAVSLEPVTAMAIPEEPTAPTSGKLAPLQIKPVQKPVPELDALEAITLTGEP